MADYFTDAMRQYGSKLPGYQRGTDPLINYYTDIMSGGPSMLNRMAPEVNAASQQYQQAMSNLQSGAYARGGGLDRNLAMLEAGKAGTISDILSRARPWASTQLGSLLSSQQQLGLQALGAAQAQQRWQTEANWRKWSGIGGGLVDILKTPIGSSGRSVLSTMLSKIPGLGGGAAATGAFVPSLAALPSAATLAPTAAASGLLGGSGVAAAGVPTGAAAGTGGLFGLGAVPLAGLGVAAALGGRAIWKSTQAHPQADKWVQERQNPFDRSMAELNTAALPPATADALRKQYLTEYLGSLSDFAKQGGHQREVANNALRTLHQWYGDLINKFGIEVPGGY